MSVTVETEVATPGQNPRLFQLPHTASPASVWGREMIGYQLLMVILLLN